MDLSTLALQAAGGFVTGALIGYALRKAVKVFLTILGLWLLSIVALGQMGVIAINWEALNELVTKIVSWLGMKTSDVASFISSAGVFGVTLAVGFFAGAGFLHSAYRLPSFKFVRRKEEED